MNATRCAKTSSLIGAVMVDKIAPQTNLMEINLGPQHPATHGVLRVVLTLDGEKVVKAVPHLGYLHRGIEKIIEDLEYFQIPPILDRLDYVANLNNELSYVIAVEKAAGITVPDRAEYIRVIMAELNRIMSHFIWFGPFTNDIGLFGTGFLFAMREREYIQRLFEKVTGARLHYNYLTIGGVRSDVPAGFADDVKEVLKKINRAVDEFIYLVEENEIFRMRTVGVGVMDGATAESFGASGPFLRASGVSYDLRKDEPYSVYDQFEFEAQTENAGDCYARYKVRLNEVRESVKIVEQALAAMPEGSYQAKVPRHVELPAGEVYARTEHPKGEFGVYMINDGGRKPYRMKLRSPSYANLMASCAIFPGMVLPDLIATMASVDIVLGCIDR
jgi:NADH-quinone oxidoreductase subunit D